MKRLLGLAAVVVAVLFTAGCLGLGESQAPSQPIINNITPSGGDNSWLAVLFVVVLVGGFLAAAGAVGFLWMWASARRENGELKEALRDLTGHTPEELRVMSNYRRRELAAAFLAVPQQREALEPGRLPASR